MDLSESIRGKGLKATPARLTILEELGSNRQAYAHAELESIFKDMDRVTLYRVLNDFEETGLVHKIIDIGGVTRFALCKQDCPDKHHTEDHVHFNCQQCNKMFCLEKIAAPVVKLPEGFKTEGSNTIVYGLCKTCNAA
jgi:Fur family ferric uptake transcriptional regulator